MTQEERRRYLLKYLLSEQEQYREMELSDSPEEQWKLFRALCNVRPPEPVSDEFLAIQDAFLQEESRRRGIVALEDLSAADSTAPFDRVYLWRGDITTLQCGAIVNAANSALLGCFSPLHGCIDNAIHTYAGIQLRLACAELMQKQGHEEPTGLAKITEAYNLPSEYVIHTVGPIVSGSLTPRHETLLRSCYRSCLETATEHGISSVAFCCISTGVFHFPPERAARIAVQTVRDYLSTKDQTLEVIFNVFGRSDERLYQRILREESGRGME